MTASGNDRPREARASEGRTGATPAPDAPDCAPALHRVFDPKRPLRVDPTAAPADGSAAAVLRCPTGALHFIRHDGSVRENTCRTSHWHEPSHAEERADATGGPASAPPSSDGG